MRTVRDLRFKSGSSPVGNGGGRAAGTMVVQFAGLKTKSRRRLSSEYGWAGMDGWLNCGCGIFE